MDTMRGQTENRMNGVERQSSWLSEKRHANTSEGVIKIHENDVLKVVIVEFDPNCFELQFCIDHRPNINFDWLGHVVDGTIECLWRAIWWLKFNASNCLFEFHKSNTAAGLPQNQVLPLGLNAGPHVGHSELILPLPVPQLICFVGRWFLLHASNNLIRLIRLKAIMIWDCQVCQLLPLSFTTCSRILD